MPGCEFPVSLYPMLENFQFSQSVTYCSSFFTKSVFNISGDCYSLLEYKVYVCPLQQCAYVDALHVPTVQLKLFAFEW